MKELDYKELIKKIINSPEYKDLQYKEAPIAGNINAKYFASRVAEFAGKIASHTGMTKEYCELLAHIKYLGVPAYGREGKIAFEEIIGKIYSQGDINIKLAEKRLRTDLSEEMKEDIRQLEYENIDDVTSNAARVVILAENISEDLERLSTEETKQLGGLTLSNTLVEECSFNEEGRIIPGRVYNKITPMLQEKRLLIDEYKVEEAKESLRNNLVDSVIEPSRVPRALEEK